MVRENSGGDWAKAEKLAKEYIIQAQVAEDLIKDLVTTLTKMEDIAVKAYSQAEAVDALFLDSPLGHQKLWHAVECQFKKLGFAPLSRGIFTPSIQIQNLSEFAGDAATWLLKLKSKKHEKAI